MAVSRDMTDVEIKVYNRILEGTFEKPIPSKDIAVSLELSERQFKDIIENLRINFRVPIVARKSKGNGYYLPRNEEEREAGLAPYKQQIRTEQKNLAIVQSINLEDFWKNKKAL